MLDGNVIILIKPFPSANFISTILLAASAKAFSRSLALDVLKNADAVAASGQWPKSTSLWSSTWPPSGPYYAVIWPLILKGKPSSPNLEEQ